ncbi:MAG TPA: asparagine--tRNA ligase, partial [Thermoprotei archaeon]|nr:asparagine--tRNA ligase [Thermoprotei archaeon]
FEAIHEFFRLNDFYEVQAPMFINVAVEGGATLFSLKYFEKGDVYLTQSSQFYLEALIFSLEKVYTIAPSFRAEKSRTRRHLTEFWHAEAEMAWYSMNDIIDFEEKLITYIVRKVLEKNIDELKLLNRDLEKLECIKPPFYRITYDDALRRLEEKEIYVEWGDDLGADEEYALTIDFNKPIFIYGYPEKIKAFYHKNDPNRPEVTLSVDLLAPEGYGEIIGGGERIENEKDLIEKIKRFGLNPKDYEWYIDLRRYGSVPHSGFGLGVDRLVWWICGLEYITDAIPFPRTIRRIYP